VEITGVIYENSDIEKLIPTDEDLAFS